MSFTYIGTTFNINDQWGPQEHQLVDSISQQIQHSFANQNNLLINTTWFGPQFSNGLYEKVQDLILTQPHIDNVFWLAMVDPLCVLPEQIAKIEQGLAAKNCYYIGGFDNSSCEFTFSSIATAEDFVNYNVNDILLDQVRHVFLCYNRKPHPHRIELVEKLHKQNLQHRGVITLGRNDSNYDASRRLQTKLWLTVEENLDQYGHNGKFNVPTNFGGVPYDLLSLGRLDIWRSHFLNVVSETAFFPWDNLFITEKTWKPILGLRPFVINGQARIYQYLRSHGFRTFNHYWAHIELEEIAEYQVHDAVIEVIKYLADKPADKIKDLYQSMLPDLIHNRNRFFEFAAEQKHKANHLFI